MSSSIRTLLAVAAPVIALALIAPSVVRAGDPYLGAKEMNETSYTYLGEGLTTAPRIRLRESVLPVSQELAGKQYIFMNGDASEDVHKVGGNMVRFVDGKQIMFYSYCCPLSDKAPEPTKANYIAFKVSPGVYFITFVEQRSRWREQQLVTFILDQNKMGFTDSFAEDDFGNGELYWMLVQGSLIEIKSDDPRYAK